MASCETNSNRSEFYHSALDTLMDSLQINSTPISNSSRCNNSLHRHFNSANESKFFSFCSTIKQYSKTKKRQNTKKMEANADSNKTPQQNVRDTPKRAVTTTRKLKLFKTTENAEEFSPETKSSSSEKELSPQSLLLKKAIVRFDYMQRKQEGIAPNKRPTRRTSLRV